MKKEIPAATRLLLLSSELADIGPITTAVQFKVLVIVASASDIGQKLNVVDLSKRAGLLAPTTSRTIQQLGYKYDKDRRPGLDLITLVTDPDDVRAKIVLLTPKGRRLWEKLKQMVEV